MHFTPTLRFSTAVTGLLVAAALALAQEPVATTAEVSTDVAAALGQKAAQTALGALTFVAATPYYDPNGNVSVYAVEFNRNLDQAPVTVIVSAWKDDVPVIMMWRGLPKHQDPAVLAAAQARIQAKLGIVVTVPEAIYWLDAYQVFAQYPEINAQNGQPVLCNLYSGQIISPAELAAKWNVRMAKVQGMTQAKTVADAAAMAGVPYVAPNQQTAAAVRRACTIGTQWASAEAYLASPASSSPVGAPTPSTAYIPNVPNIDQGFNNDCVIVSTLDIMLYWDHRGYERLIDNPEVTGLDVARNRLRSLMSYNPTSGTYIVNMPPGTMKFCNDAAESNQYAFTVANVPNASFATFTGEINAGRPAQVYVYDYTDDPNNPTDNAYGNHAVCGVGYYSGAAFTGSTATEWAIIHDNWFGGTYANPYILDDEPYIDWSRVSGDGGICTIVPGPWATRCVTYPSVGGIVWQAGTTQLLTWRGFVGSTVKIDLCKGNFFYRNIDAAAPNDPTNGVYSYALPSDLPTYSDYRVKITSNGTFDYSDSTIQMLSSNGMSNTRGLVVGTWSSGPTAVWGTRWTVPTTPISNAVPTSTHTIATTTTTAPTVTYPSNTGITLRRGWPVSIRWKNFTGSALRIDLYKGTNMVATLAASTGNDGNQTWYPASSLVPGNDYRIVISSVANPAQYDASDAAFTIQ